MNPSSLPLFDCKLTLFRHTKPINVLKISPDGRKLLSGADDSMLIVWNLEDGSEEQTISVAFNGPVTSAAWMPVSEGTPNAAFAFSTGDGNLFLYKYHTDYYNFAFSTVAHVGPIEDIAFDPYYKRLATVGNGRLKLWEIDEKFVASNSITTPPKSSIARCVSFLDGGREILVSFLDSREVVRYQVSPWMMRWSYQLPTRIGHCVLSGDGQSLIVSNLRDGLDFYSLPPSQPLRTFKHNITRNVPLVVSSALEGRITIVGGDDGYARMYDPNMGLMTSVLQHGNAGTLVQAVDARSCRNLCIVVTGSSDNDDIKIKVWMPRIAEAKKKQASTLAPASKYSGFLKYLLVIAIALYLNYQLIRLHNILSDTKEHGTGHQATTNGLNRTNVTQGTIVNRTARLPV